MWCEPASSLTQSTSGVPERAGVEGYDPPPGAGEALQQHSPARAAADDDQVDLVVVVEAAHVRPQLVVGALTVQRQQPSGLVAGPDCVHLVLIRFSLGTLDAFQDAHWLSPRRRGRTSRRRMSGTGSDGERSGRSHGSRLSSPMFL